MQVMKKKPKGNKGRGANKPLQTKVEEIPSFFRWVADHIMTKWGADLLPVAACLLHRSVDLAACMHSCRNGVRLHLS